MRSIIITIICFFLFAFTQAQLTFGPKAGLNLARTAFTAGDFKATFRPDFYIGLFANYQINTHFAGQFEVLYSGEGTKEKGVPSGTTGHINEKYLQIPLLVQYHTKIGFYGEAGPQLGLMLASHESYGNIKEDIKQYYHVPDFRFPIGVGYEFPATSPVRGLGINARYSFSFAHINKVSVGGQTLKNQVISIGAFYKLPLHVKMKKGKMTIWYPQFISS